jgi:ADP-ribosylglycohydrolase
MGYPRLDRLGQFADQVKLYAQLKHERGARGVASIVRQAEKALKTAIADLTALDDDPQQARREPSRLDDIRPLRPQGPRRLWQSFDKRNYQDKLEGALLGRMAGCVLGAPVELWPVAKMEALAKENGQAFPPREYWLNVSQPWETHYQTSPRRAYTRDGMKGVPVDDDIMYTLLGLLIAEEFGPGFTVDDVGKAWLKYLPHACTAEDIALKNLKKGVTAGRAAEKDNPYVEWIGADIRADPWGYLAPGWPERAADFAWRDAYLSHRRQGVYGAMFFAAAIAAAFAVDDPVEALRAGLTEIPRQSTLATHARWALDVAPQIKTHRDARDAADERFAGMHPVHTVNNACLTIWGVTIGGTDLSKVIGETVAMGLDNDCTAATAGSIVGAVAGKRGIPEHWHRNFNNTIHSYLIGKRAFRITDVVKRFTREAQRVWNASSKQ